MEKTGKVVFTWSLNPLSFSSLHLLSITIKRHRLLASKLTCDLGNSEMFRYGGMANLLLCWGCSV